MIVRGLCSYGCERRIKKSRGKNSCGKGSFLEDTEEAAEGVGGVFVVSDGDGVDAHFDDGVIVAAGLSHVAKVKDILFLDAELF